MTVRVTLTLLVVLSVGLLVAGCGGPVRYQTRGRILKNGELFRPPEGDTFRVTLVPINDDGSRVTNWYAANYHPEDGTFTAAGPDNKGVPPGKYRVCLEQLRNRNDVLRGAFFGDKSPYVREVRSSSDEITIDLAKPE
jgi:hypothetical protein